uniref:Protein kinase domain-containing protein n=1 Tax=Trichogramma kaykai TaxID=54128 RepID=A0ABD2XIF6_9HYME
MRVLPSRQNRRLGRLYLDALNGGVGDSNKRRHHRVSSTENLLATIMSLRPNPPARTTASSETATSEPPPSPPPSPAPAPLPPALPDPDVKEDDNASTTSTTTTTTDTLMSGGPTGSQEFPNFGQKTCQSVCGSTGDLSAESSKGPKMLGERYLLLGMTEGSSLYRCLDIKTNRNLVAKGFVRQQQQRVLIFLARLARVTHILPSPIATHDNEGYYTLHHCRTDEFTVEKYILFRWITLIANRTIKPTFDPAKKRESLLTKGDKGADSLLQAHTRLQDSGAVSPLAGLVDGDDHQRYLLLEGHYGDLHAYVRSRRRLREIEARQLFRQATEAVMRCHEEGVVLRDLKLRKFVFADEARTQLRLESLEDAVLVDVDDDRLTDRRGCPAYVAPEVLRSGQAYSGKAADIWSLGVLLYTMLAGKYPFNDTEHASLFYKITRGQFAVPELLGSRAKCLIRSLLRKEPAERPEAEDVLRHPWLSRPLKKYCINCTSLAVQGGNAFDGHKNHKTNMVDQIVPDFALNED